MKYGIIISPTADTIRPDKLACELERRGFESLWIPEHTHMPVSARKEGAPDSYGRTYDPFVALASAAVVTNNLILGTGICLLAQHHPITCAKSVASLDRLSGGRVRFGIGGGWNRPEIENHGVDFSQRWSVLEEHLEAMKQIWTQTPAEFHGEHVDFDPLVSGPSPVQEPHPPVLLGATGSEALDRVARFCDGWIPLAGAVDDLEASLRELREKTEQAGRQFSKLEISLFSVPRKARELQRYADLGATRAIFMIEPKKPDEVLRELDEITDLTSSAKSILS